MIKLLCLLVVMTIGSMSFGQKSEVDNRLVKNFGEEIFEIKKNRNDFYQYLLFEIKEGFQVKNKKELTSEEKSVAVKSENFKNNEGEVLTLSEIDSPNFNFEDFGLKVKTKSTTIIRLSKKQYFILRSKVDIANEFKNNPLNHK